MVALTALSVALFIAGTYVESLPRSHVFFLIFSGVMFEQVEGTDVWTDERLNEMEEVWLALYSLSRISFRNSSRVSNSLDPDKV